MKLYLNQNIKLLRLRNNITQLELSNRLNLSYRAIQTYEQNRLKPRIEHIVEIANFFNITLDELVLKDLSKQ